MTIGPDLGESFSSGDKYRVSIRRICMTYERVYLELGQCSVAANLRIYDSRNVREG
jgi:hypothetical protein